MAVTNPYREGSAKAKAFDLLKSGKPVKFGTIHAALKKLVNHPTQALYGFAVSPQLKPLGKVIFNPDADSVQFVSKSKGKKTAPKKAAKLAKEVATPVEA